MGRGFLAGIFWGGLVGVAILFVANQAMDRRELSLPKPEATEIEVPAGTEFDQARPETDPVVPEVETRPEADPVAGVAVPDDAVEEPSTFDTSSLEVPQPSIESPGGLGETPEVADEVAIDVTGPGDSAAPAGSPTLAQPEAPTTAPETTTEAPDSAPTEPETEETAEVDAPAPTVETEIAMPVAPETVETAEAPLPQAVELDTSEAPSVPVAPAPAPAATVAPDIDDSLNTIIRPDGGESEFFRPVDDITNRAPNVETDRLPRIGAAPTVDVAGVPAVRRIGEEEEEPLDLPSDDDPVPADGPALLKWRIPFDGSSGLPRLALVLVHDGSQAMPSDVLDGVPEFVGFGIDSGMAGAAGIAAAYRAAGREVVMIPSLPVGATPQDVEVALRVNFDTVPEAVAVMDSSGDSFQSDRAAVAQVVDVVANSGHGLITFPRGLNTAHQQAGRVGVPTALIFRDIDGSNQTIEQIIRALDRAAFRARPGTAVVLVGRSGADTLEALREWIPTNRASSVVLTPVSAALLGE
ncbi:MAG: hypothetical protein GKR98_05300 [Boseongicola sp.]|nr:MAG: hypothetical protein GKR98_05300 [Boseongicola sp.]